MLPFSDVFALLLFGNENPPTRVLRTQGLHLKSVRGGARGKDTKLSVRSLESCFQSMIRIYLIMSLQRAGIQLALRWGMQLWRRR